MYASSKIKSSYVSRLTDVCKRISKEQDKYELVALETGIDWRVIAAIHYRESNLNFSKNLHNGQPLNMVTTWVPKGRGPFHSWEESAIDALGLKKNLGMPKKVSEWLYFLECYNGLGYLRNYPDVNSPYLWSGSDKYVKGKYVSDGKYSANTVDIQLGCVIILKYFNIEKDYEL
jgi:lysozyme family protein